MITVKTLLLEVNFYHFLVKFQNLLFLNVKHFFIKLYLIPYTSFIRRDALDGRGKVGDLLMRDELSPPCGHFPGCISSILHYHFVPGEKKVSAAVALSISSTRGREREKERLMSEEGRRIRNVPIFTPRLRQIAWKTPSKALAVPLLQASIFFSIVVAVADVESPTFFLLLGFFLIGFLFRLRQSPHIAAAGDFVIRRLEFLLSSFMLVPFFYLLIFTTFLLCSLSTLSFLEFCGPLQSSRKFASQFR